MSPFVIPITTDVGDIATALAEFAKLGGDLIGVLDNPVIMAARKNVEEAAMVKKADDDLDNAQKTGDYTKVDQDASG